MNQQIINFAFQIKYIFKEKQLNDKTMNNQSFSKDGI